jgi:hypothetical protein
MNVDLKSKIELYLPSLIQLIEGDLKKKRWKRLTEIFENQFNKLNEQYKKDEKFPLVKLSLYSTITGALNGERQNIQFLDYINNVFKNLNSILDKDEKILIKETLSNLLEFEKGFLNYLGELSVLDNLISTGLYKLDKTEYRIKENGKGIDFRFLNIQKSKYILVEVINIELKDNKISSTELMYQFLSNKLNDKLNDTDKSEILNYTLIPVIWGSLENILKVREFYKLTNFKIKRVEIPRVYIPFNVPNNPKKFVNKFGSILTVFNGSTEELKI